MLSLKKGFEEPEGIRRTLNEVKGAVRPWKENNMLTPNELHQVMMSGGVREAKLTYSDDEIYTYIYLNENEFQLFRRGDCPKNYILDKSLENG